MNIKKISLIMLTSMLVGGCYSSNSCREGSTTFGVADNKWAMMSMEQRESAKEVFRSDQIKLAEQAKLNTLNQERAAANEQREIQHKDELSRIDLENSQIRHQQRKVGSITEKENLRQRQREQDLDIIKD